MSLKYTPPLLILALCLLIGCNKTPIQPSQSWQLLPARDNGLSPDTPLSILSPQSLSLPNRPLLYRALVPSHWTRQDPSPEESIIDTTKAICAFTIHENDQLIRLTIHTFPILQDRMRIPPQAQIARWKGQFEELDLVATHTLPDAHGGFSGLFFEGEGILHGNDTKVIGWSMQLAPIFERQLNQGRDPLDQYKRADYTIKASGPPDLMNKHRQEILTFARSFELIDELPAPQ